MFHFPRIAQAGFVVAGIVGLPTALLAQPGGQVSTQVAIQGGNAACAPQVVSAFSLSSVRSASCADGGRSGSVFASAAGGIVRASTVGTNLDGRGTVHSFAFAQWIDNLSWNAPGQAASLTFTVALNGGRSGQFYQSPAYDPYHLVEAGAFGSLHFSGNLPTSTVNRNFDALHYIGANAVADSLGTEPSFNFNDSRLMSFTYDVGAAQTGTVVNLQLYTYLEAFSMDPNGYAISSSDYSAQLSDIYFRDRSGNDITDQMNYQFANGTQVSAVTATPEPTGLSLLGTGLLGIAGWRRRRRIEKPSCFAAGE